MVVASRLEIEDHARLFNLKGDTSELKGYLGSEGYVVVDSGIDSYDVIFDEEHLGRCKPCNSEGIIDNGKKRLVVFASTRLEQVVDEYRSRNSPPTRDGQEAGSPSV